MVTAVPMLLQLFTLGDSDGDTIMDLNDSCPFSPETYNKFQDEDGCPDLIADNKLLQTLTVTVILM